MPFQGQNALGGPQLLAAASLGCEGVNGPSVLSKSSALTSGPRLKRKHKITYIDGGVTFILLQKSGYMYRPLLRHSHGVPRSRVVGDILGLSSEMHAP